MIEETNKDYCVYVHTCPNGKIYIGCTRNVKNRWRPSNYKRCNTPFKDAIECFGWCNIKHEILYSNLTRDESLKLEDQLIVKARENGTCLNANRSGHYQDTEEFREEHNARRKSYHESHKEEDKAYYEAHKEDKVTYNKAYYEKNKEKIKARARERYNSKKGGGSEPEPLF